LNFSGEFLDPSIPKLPLAAMRVALVYNAKEEASPLASRTADPAENPPSSLPSASSFANNRQRVSVLPASLAPERVNDMYAEWDTMETVNAVREAIEERHSVLMIEANEDAFETFRQRKFDFVFNIAEGLHGSSREAQVPAMLEMLRIPYLGSDPLTLALCLDKSRAKEVLSHHEIPTAAFTVVHSREELEDARVRFPSIVKPLHEGSSKGVYNSCVVRDTGELEREVNTIFNVYREPALIEEFLTGREFTVALLGNGEDLRVLPIVEIKFDALPPGANPIYSYEAKWMWDSRENPLQIFECPATLSDSLQSEIEELCRSTYRVLRCRDWSRIDVRCDARGKAHIIEVNPLPGILPKPEDNSCFPKAARAAGMTYSQLINSVLDISMKRCGLFSQETERKRASSN
jgi:D-alanine-D-alanine ligase